MPTPIMLAMGHGRYLASTEGLGVLRVRTVSVCRWSAAAGR